MRFFSLLVSIALLLVSSRSDADETDVTTPSIAIPPPPPASEPEPPKPAPAPAAPPEEGRFAPVGRPAPATEAATRGTGAVKAGLEIFASYSYQNLNSGGTRTWYHVFDLPRAHGAVEGELGQVKGRLLVEATRSAAEGALIGVSGDSLVLRIREAYANYRPLSILDLSAGVIPTATIPELDGTWMMRPVAPSLLESSGLAAPADIGARARVTLPDDFGTISTSVYNGEGYTNRELNRGKNLEVAADIHPVPLAALKPLGIFGSYVAGSAGTTKARADRVTGGLVWQGARVRAGAFTTYAVGVRDAARQHALLLSAFVRVEPLPRVLLGARADHFVRDTDAVPEDRLTTLLVSGGYRVSDPLEAFLVLSRSIPTTRAEAALPGTDAFELRAVGRIVF